MVVRDALDDTPGFAARRHVDEVVVDERCRQCTSIDGAERSLRVAADVAKDGSDTVADSHAVGMAADAALQIHANTADVDDPISVAARNDREPPVACGIGFLEQSATRIEDAPLSAAASNLHYGCLLYTSRCV